MKTSNSGITAVFQVINVSYRGEKHPELSDNQYYGYFHDILECDFESFKRVVFDVKWFRLRIHEYDPIEHAI